MRFRLILQPPADADGDGVASPWCEGTLRVGSGADCDLSLAGLPDLACTFSRSGQGQLKLVPADAALKIEALGKRVPEEGVSSLHGGTDIRVGPYRLTLLVAFERAAQVYRLDRMATAMLVLIAAVLVMEVFLIGWLPTCISNLELWGVAQGRERARDLLDEERLALRTIEPNLKRDEELAASAMIGTELNRIAVYFRRYSDQLESKDVNDIYARIFALKQQIEKLDAGVLLAPHPKLDTSKAIETMLSPKGDN
jgi:hypothetical protein